MDHAFIDMVHGTGSFPCWRYICAAVQRRRVVLTHVFLNMHCFFCELCIGVSFFFASCSGSMVYRFFPTRLQRLALSKMNAATFRQWRKGESKMNAATFRQWRKG